MIRFIVERKWRDAYSGLETVELLTVDANCDDLEAILSEGGFGESGYDHRVLKGAELMGGPR